MANDSALDLKVDVSYVHEGVRRPWREWLQARFGFKADRLIRLGRTIWPWEFAEAVAKGNLGPIEKIKDTDGDGRLFFTSDDLERIADLSSEERFEIETMRLEDLPRVDVTEGTLRRGFDHLSTGQQHSVLLSLLLCADRSDPLIIDQPEDHLDAPYIANAVVRHLEAAKERRQVIIATHNANLTVLGDADSWFRSTRSMAMAKCATPGQSIIQTPFGMSANYSRAARPPTRGEDSDTGSMWDRSRPASRSDRYRPGAPNGVLSGAWFGNHYNAIDDDRASPGR